jgi:ribonuclease HII
MPCDLSHEDALHEAGIRPVCGIDEAGRGPLAGPLAVAAVILPAGFSLPGLDDSKRLNPARRERFAAILLADPGVRSALVWVEAREIDRINILEATRAGMRRACLALAERPACALIDGLAVPDFPIPQRALVGGDGLSLSIAAASVIAKVARDHAMRELDARFPGYGFARHMGYGTRDHLAALARLGPCPAHRRSFRPVRLTAAATAAGAGG